MVLKLFTTFIVVAAILASPKQRDFTWSYRSSIYRVHCGCVIMSVADINTVIAQVAELIVVSVYIYNDRNNVPIATT